MFNYSFSTVLMAVLTSNLIIIMIAVCFRSNKILLSVGYKLLAVFLIFTLLRFLLPFEIGSAKNIIWPEFLSKLISYIRREFFDIYGFQISLWALFEVIWGIGIICCTILYLRKLFKFEYYVSCWSEDVTEEEPYRSCLAEVCENQKNKFRILKLPGINSPSLYGIRRPRILIPADLKMTDNDLYYVLRHEVSHHYHHDLIIKRVVSILRILYWWNPVCYIFQKQVNVLLEMRIDDSLVEGNPETARAYLSTLVNMAEKACSKSAISSDIFVSLSQQNTTSLTQRFNMVCNRKPHANGLLSSGLIALVIAMYLGSYLVTFENLFFIEGKWEDNYAAETDSVYAIIKDDGTYDVYYGELFIENIESLDYYMDVPIYNQH